MNKNKKKKRNYKGVTQDENFHLKFDAKDH